VTSGGWLEVAVTDVAGHVTRSRTDALGRTRQAVDAEYRVTTYSCDPNGNVIQLRDPNSVGYDATFDVRNRELTRTDTQGDRIFYGEYDAQNNLTKRKDAFDRETTFAYDARDRRRARRTASVGSRPSLTTATATC